VARLGLLAAAFAGLVLNMELWEWPMRALFPDLPQHLYTRTAFSRLVWQHLGLVAVSSGLAAAIGVALGVAVTRRRGRDFLPVVSSLVSVGQTFPPVAVLALMVPVVGFGARPTIVALLVYGLLPVVRNTISGLEGVSAEVVQAARAMGMTKGQVLRRVELRLALPVIMAGVRTSVVINIGTATLGATIGAGGLGAPIIAGLIGQNPAYILEGAVVAGLLAVIADNALEQAEAALG
jgi:osmoprotectant transport system permease protein